MGGSSCGRGWEDCSFAAVFALRCLCCRTRGSEGIVLDFKHLEMLGEAPGIRSTEVIRSCDGSRRREVKDRTRGISPVSAAAPRAVPEAPRH